MKRFFNVTIVTKDLDDDYFPGHNRVISVLTNSINAVFPGVLSKVSVKQLDEPYQKSIKKLERALDLACKKVPLECPDPPERYNIQREVDSDEPYWITEGGCEEENPNCLDCMRQCFLRKAAAQIKNDPLDWYL